METKLKYSITVDMTEFDDSFDSLWGCSNKVKSFKNTDQELTIITNRDSLKFNTTWFDKHIQEDDEEVREALNWDKGYSTGEIDVNFFEVVKIKNAEWYEDREEFNIELELKVEYEEIDDGMDEDEEDDE